MERRLGVHPLRCAARTYALLVDDRVLRHRCKDRNCPEAVHAKEHNLIAVHCFDIETRAEWTEYEPQKRHQE